MDQLKKNMIIECMVNKCSKILNTFLVLFSYKMLVVKAVIHKMFVGIANRTNPDLFSNKMLVVKAVIHKMLVIIPTGKTMIRLLLQKQSDLGLHCLTRSL